MSTVLDRPARRATESRNPDVTDATTTPSRDGGAKNRHGAPASRRRQRVFTGRGLLIGMGIAVAWGLFLWLFVGGSIASFGNPWLYS